jgi:tetratricopeptide (TPR) repeat protein
MSDDAKLILGKVRRLADAQQLDEAIQLCSRLIDSEPNLYDAFKQRAHLFARIGKWTSAIEDITRAIELNSEEPAFYFSRARWHIQAKEFVEAIRDLGEVIDLEKYHSDTYYLESAYFFRALCHRGIGRPDLVLKDCENVSEDFSTYTLGVIQQKSELMQWALEKTKNN